MPSVKQIQKYNKCLPQCNANTIFSKKNTKNTKYTECLPQGPHQLECPVLSCCPQNLRPVFQPPPRSNTNGNLEDACNAKEENGGTKRDENTHEATSEDSSAKKKVSS